MGRKKQGRRNQLLNMQSVGQGVRHSFPTEYIFISNSCSYLPRSLPIDTLFYTVLHSHPYSLYTDLYTLCDASYSFIKKFNCRTIRIKRRVK